MRDNFNYGKLFFAITIAAFGIIQLVFGNFLVALLPVSPSLEGRTMGIYFSSALFIGIAACILTGFKARPAAALLAMIFLLVFALLHVPILLSNIYNGGAWTGAAEIVGLAGGAFIISGALTGSSSDFIKLKDATAIKLGSTLFVILLFVVGVQHFMYADFIATLIPAWIPMKAFFAYAVGVAFFASGISILLNKNVKLACSLLALMFMIWVVILHVPRVVENTNTEAEWTSAFIAFAVSGISLMISVASNKR